tara:strand:+ start:418 stop:675 length:258 start_codon:yes stop_codon:yes gene_type:complete
MEANQQVRKALRNSILDAVSNDPQPDWRDSLTDALDAVDKFLSDVCEQLHWINHDLDNAEDAYDIGDIMAKITTVEELIESKEKE